MARKRLRTVEQPLRIERLSHEGRGVARIDGKTVFVDGALPEELVRVTLTKRRSRFDEARTDEVLESSPLRVAPPCEYHGYCGGCSLQHMSAQTQIAHKQSVLLELMARENCEPAHVLPPLTGPTLAYRRKARLGVKLVPKKGGVLVGFREKGKPYVADIDRCAVLHPAIGEKLTSLRGLIGSLSIANKIPQLEVAVDGDGRCSIIFRHLEALTDTDTLKLRDFSDAEQIDIYLQPGGPDTIAALAVQAQPHYLLADGQIRVDFQVSDFTQVNFEINQSLVERVTGLLSPCAGERGLDLFCGLGNFTLPLARAGGQWTGLEGEAGLIDRARVNAERNGIDNVHFEVADLAAQPLPEIVQQPAELILIDPPRTGAELIVQQLNFSSLNRLVYVSCNPATLARDTAHLVNNEGLRLVSAGVMDMFPHTAHVESIAVFEP